MPEASREAYEQLEEAIKRVIRERGALEDGEMLVEFAIICEVQDFTDPETNAYVTIYPNGYLATHRAVGLHKVALNRALHEGWTEGS